MRWQSYYHEVVQNANMTVMNLQSHTSQLARVGIYGTTRKIVLTFTVSQDQFMNFEFNVVPFCLKYSFRLLPSHMMYHVNFPVDATHRYLGYKYILRNIIVSSPKIYVLRFFKTFSFETFKSFLFI